MPAKLNLIGQKFGKLTVIEETPDRKNNSVVWKCKCDCGNEIKLSTKELRSDGIQKCRICGLERCPKTGRNNKYIGKTFGNLTIIKPTERRSGNKIIYECRCICGNTTYSTITEVQSGNKISCGCMRSKYQIGDIINNRQVLAKTGNKKGRFYYRCKCMLCGREYDILAQTLNKTISCGCQRSIGEYNIIQILNKYNILYQKEYILDKKTAYRYDFALFNKNNELYRLIEFDGEQHYEKNIKQSGWNTYQKYEYTLNNDKAKNKLAKEYNIPLVRIPYWERDSITLDLLLGNKYLIS